MTTKREGTTKCGWCITGDHAHCRIQTNPWQGKTITCPCPCRKRAAK